ncbi:MAG TPA: MerR family transcriptional regulator [Gemmatimonadales bacterium]|nr:MerR family transcriptional regulator [Gemmatimonadales bacterium]
MNRDPLEALRGYRSLAPWNLHDLAALAGAILDASGVRPVNAAASARPNERTIRFYVTRGLVTPPDGRGTAATYGYRHLLQVLAIKLRQMEGATLGTIARELSETTGDVLERRVASALGSALPDPAELQDVGKSAAPTAGRAFQALRVREVEPTADTGHVSGPWHHITLGPGAELHLAAGHPLLAEGADVARIAEAVRLALARLHVHEQHRVS